jgi:hypothetical protein
MTFDPDFRRLPRRCRHNRNPVDDRAQCLRSTFVPVSKIASDQLIQGLAAFRGRVSREARYFADLRLRVRAPEGCCSEMEQSPVATP